jgi:hypothetical protein
MLVFEPPRSFRFRLSRPFIHGRRRGIRRWLDRRARCASGDNAGGDGGWQLPGRFSCGDLDVVILSRARTADQHGRGSDGRAAGNARKQRPRLRAGRDWGWPTSNPTGQSTRRAAWGHAESPGRRQARRRTPLQRERESANSGAGWRLDGVDGGNGHWGLARGHDAAGQV